MSEESRSLPGPAATAALAVVVGLGLLAIAGRGPARATAPGELRWLTEWPAVDGLAPLAVETLAANRREIRGPRGTVAGFGAGQHYPQLWIRDSATLLPVARWTEDRDRLTGWLEEHLVHQRRDGRLYDWIAAGGRGEFAEWAPKVVELARDGDRVLSADRNTVELDQESSAVIAAGRIFDITGDVGWLATDLGGVALLQRLDRALEWLSSHRRGEAGGLLVGPLSADWGDVSPSFPDQRAIYDDPVTPRVAGLYPNALFVGASRALSKLHLAAGDRARAREWEAVGADVAAAIDRLLWDEDAGFYRVHLLLTPVQGIGDAGRFALGGNAIAALHGVADAPRTCRILSAAEQRRRRHGFSTIAATLLPPFPEGFFAHPILREEWTYQNGGQWDWFAGRLLTAAFGAGCASEAREQLLRIARRVEASGGIYEWYDREDRGRGSARYAGSAAALGQAVTEGLLGVELSSSGLQLAVRTGVAPAAVRLREPATGARVHYTWRFDEASGRGRLDWRATRGGPVEVLVPEGWTVAEAWLDGAPVPARERALGADRYVGVRAAGGTHRLDVQMRAAGARGR